MRTSPSSHVLTLGGDRSPAVGCGNSTSTPRSGHRSERRGRRHHGPPTGHHQHDGHERRHPGRRRRGRQRRRRARARAVQLTAKPAPLVNGSCVRWLTGGRRRVRRRHRRRRHRRPSRTCNPGTNGGPAPTGCGPDSMNTNFLLPQPAGGRPAGITACRRLHRARATAIGGWLCVGAVTRTSTPHHMAAPEADCGSGKCTPSAASALPSGAASAFLKPPSSLFGHPPWGLAGAPRGSARRERRSAQVRHAQFRWRRRTALNVTWLHGCDRTRRVVITSGSSGSMLQGLGPRRRSSVHATRACVSSPRCVPIGGVLALTCGGGEVNTKTNGPCPNGIAGRRRAPANPYARG